MVAYGDAPAAVITSGWSDCTEAVVIQGSSYMKKKLAHVDASSLRCRMMTSMALRYAHSTRLEKQGHKAASLSFR